MSWYGMHYSPESELALSHLSLGHCRLCRYKARLQFDAMLWKEHHCDRCGCRFPATAIDKEKWFYEMRGKAEVGRVGDRGWSATIFASHTQDRTEQELRRVANFFAGKEHWNKGFWADDLKRTEKKLRKEGFFGD